MKYNLKWVLKAKDFAQLRARLNLYCIRELREKYAKLCETRIQNMKDDAIAFFIEELLNAEPEEILGE